MTVDKIVADEEFGHIYIKGNARAKRYLFHPAKDGSSGVGVLVTVPARFVLDDVLRAVETMRPRLREMLEAYRAQQGRSKEGPRIGWDFRIESDSIVVELVKGQGEGFALRHQSAELPARMQLVCPPDCDFGAPGRQEWLVKVIEEGLRRHAKAQLLPRLVGYAAQYGIRLHDVKVNSSKGRWGSCARHGHQAQLAGRGQEYYNINLSLYTLLLPLPVQRLVMLHELMHTRHMDHSAAFHHELDEWLEGKEKALEQELKRYATSIFAFTTGQ